MKVSAFQKARNRRDEPCDLPDSVTLTHEGEEYELEVGMETDIMPTYLDDPLPARLESISWYYRGGSWVLMTGWRFTEEAADRELPSANGAEDGSHMVGKYRRIEGYNVPYCVFKRPEYDSFREYQFAETESDLYRCGECGDEIIAESPPGCCGEQMEIASEAEDR